MSSTQFAVLPRGTRLYLVPSHNISFRRAIYSMSCDFNRALNWLCDDKSTASVIDHLFSIEAYAREALAGMFDA